MLPLDDGRVLLAQERIEALRAQARPVGGRPGRLRRQLGGALIAAGKRVAGQRGAAAPRPGHSTA